MTLLLLALGLIILLMSLGVGLQRFFVNKASQESKTPLVMSVFIGLGFLLHLLNLIQYLGLPEVLLLMLVPLIVYGFKPILLSIQKIERTEIVILIAMGLLLIFDLLILKPDLPVISWDSWLGWELKARQWIVHGLSANLLDATQWFSQKEGVYSSTAHYPDGLPLMYYLLKSMGDENNLIMGYLYLLSYFCVVLMVVFRLRKQGVNPMMLVWSVLLLTTLPLLNNHIKLQGYADIWLAMILLLSVMSLSDWNQRKSTVNFLRLLLFLSMLPLFKIEGWVWLSLLLMAQFVSKFLIRRHRWIVLTVVVLTGCVWFMYDNWSFSWAARTVIVSQDYLKLGSVFEMSLMPVDVSHEILVGLFLQNNWGLLWYFMPFILMFWLLVKHPKHQQVTQTFFVLSFSAFLLLFFFTDASKWAENYTAVNRIVLQLTPVFAYLVIQAFVTWQKKGLANQPLNRTDND